jgi:hypothetical protein
MENIPNRPAPSCDGGSRRALMRGEFRAVAVAVVVVDGGRMFVTRKHINGVRNGASRVARP